ncbi:MAG: parB-like partition protein [Polaromonas sp.]|nr:parB-like partition protein [Polaromonas sp.]
MASNFIGQTVTLHRDLLDLKAKPHAYAGKRVLILNKTRKTYCADTGDGNTCVFFDGDFTAPAAAPATPAASQGTQYIHTAGMTSQVITVPRGMLVESPFNPRTVFNEKPLQELAESIKAVGIMQPLLVRPTSYMGGKPSTYEIVFGHRRYRAAALAGLLQVPVMVRTLTDEQCARVQAIENLQREDLNPIEEAQGYANHRRLHNMSAQQLADHIGLSRTTVYNTLKLLDLCPEGQALVQSGALGTELGTMIARVGGPEVQAPVLKKIFYGADLATVTADSQTMSTRQGIKLIDDLAAKTAGTAKPSTPKAAAGPKIIVGPRLFSFTSHEDWVDSAKTRFRDHAISSDRTLCLDQKGRVLGWGEHFSQARDEDAFPVDVYLLRADMEAEQS